MRSGRYIYIVNSWAFTMLKSVYMSRIQYDALSVRISDMVRDNVKGNLNVLNVERKITRASIVRTILSAPIVVNLTWLFWFTSKSSWFFGVLNPGKYCLSFN
jgi:hypothetical protein